MGTHWEGDMLLLLREVAEGPREGTDGKVSSGQKKGKVEQAENVGPPRHQAGYSNSHL